MSAVGVWDATTYEGKDTILRVVRQEAERLYAMTADPAIWERDTACARWSTRDVVGHLIDTTEGYFAAFDAARANTDPGVPHGLPSMSQLAGDSAIAFRDVPREELLDRARGDFEKVMELLGAIGPEDWGGFIVTHPYMGPLPAWFYAVGQLIDYTVHSWDIRDGSGRAHALSGDAADLLVPFMFLVWQSTLSADADRSSFNLGIRVTSGANAGDFRIGISPDGMTYEVGSVADEPCVLEFDAASLVLAAYGRCNTGTVRGDQAIADRFLNLFFRI